MLCVSEREAVWSSCDLPHYVTILSMTLHSGATLTEAALTNATGIREPKYLPTQTCAVQFCVSIHHHTVPIKQARQSHTTTTKKESFPKMTYDACIARLYSVVCYYMKAAAVTHAPSSYISMRCRLWHNSHLIVLISPQS